MSFYECELSELKVIASEEWLQEVGSVCMKSFLMSVQSTMRVKCAKVHGVVASFSPMKVSASKKCNYFEGQLSDGKKSMMLFGFDTKQQQKLALS